MGLKEGPLTLILTKIELSSEYKSKEKTSTGFILPLYTSLPPILSPTPIDSSLTWVNMTYNK